MSLLYPYILQKLIVAESSQDAVGDFNEQTEVWKNVCNCRNENSKQRSFQLTDSKYLTSSHLLQCPKGTKKLNDGDVVRVLNADLSVRLKGQVIYSEEMRLHTQIWL